MARSDTPEYRIGYGKPPTDTQFQEGQSGNPVGRPKKRPPPPPPAGLSAADARFLSLLDEVAEEGVGKGKRRGRRMTRAEAIDRALIERAMMGDVRAIKMVREREMQARAAEAQARQRAENVDNREWVLNHARLMRWEAYLRGLTLPPDIHEALWGKPPAPDAGHDESAPAPAGEDASACDDVPEVASTIHVPAIEADGRREGEAVEGMNCGPDTAPQERDAPCPAREAWDAQLPGPREPVVWGGEQKEPTPPRIGRGASPSNEPLIKNTAPLTWPF